MAPRQLGHGAGSACSAERWVVYGVNAGCLAGKLRSAALALAPCVLIPDTLLRPPRPDGPQVEEWEELREKGLWMGKY